jgi:hypothetical protein
LEKLLDYISDEIRAIMNTEVALVILLDEQRNEFSYVGVAHDTPATEKRIKEFRFPAARSVAGKVVRTGEPIQTGSMWEKSCAVWEAEAIQPPVPPC